MDVTVISEKYSLIVIPSTIKTRNINKRIEKYTTIFSQQSSFMYEMSYVTLNSVLSSIIIMIIIIKLG